MAFMASAVFSCQLPLPSGVKFLHEEALTVIGIAHLNQPLNILFTTSTKKNRRIRNNKSNGHKLMIFTSSVGKIHTTHSLLQATIGCLFLQIFCNPKLEDRKNSVISLYWVVIVYFENAHVEQKYENGTEMSLLTL